MARWAVAVAALVAGLAAAGQALRLATTSTEVFVRDSGCPPINVADARTFVDGASWGALAVLATAAGVALVVGASRGHWLRGGLALLLAWPLMLAVNQWVHAGSDIGWYCSSPELGVLMEDDEPSWGELRVLVGAAVAAPVAWLALRRDRAGD